MYDKFYTSNESHSQARGFKLTENNIKRFIFVIIFHFELYWNSVQLKCLEFHYFPLANESEEMVQSMIAYREYVLALERGYKEARRLEFMIMEGTTDKERYDKEMMKRIDLFSDVLGTMDSKHIKLEWGGKLSSGQSTLVV